MTAQRTPLSAAERKVFALLRERAERGAECPINRELSEAADRLSRTSASELLLALERKGWIRVERRTHNLRRVVILETGDATAWTSRARRPRLRVVELDYTAPSDAEMRRRAHEQYWLDKEAQRYGLSRRGRPLSEMAV